jgi:uncharacterized protein (TIGR01777 family)
MTKTGMKVVIAGGSGLIGRALCSALVQAGHRPVVLSRNPRRARLPSGARCVEWHPPESGPWTSELDGADALVNLAGESVGVWPWTSRRKRVLRESRLIPTRTLVEAMAALPEAKRPRILVNASGTDLYEGRDAAVATEATEPGETLLARLCLDWETEAMRAQEIGVRVVLARTSLVIAPGAPSLRLLSLPFRLLVGGRVGSGRQWMSWIDIDDVVALILWAIDHEEIRGPINVAAPDPRHQVDVARALGAAIHRPSWFPTPAFAIRLALGGQATLALGSRRVWPEKALASGFDFRFKRLERSLEQHLR